MTLYAYRASYWAFFGSKSWEESWKARTQYGPFLTSSLLRCFVFWARNVKIKLKSFTNIINKNWIRTWRACSLILGKIRTYLNQNFSKLFFESYSEIKFVPQTFSWGLFGKYEMLERKNFLANFQMEFSATIWGKYYLNLSYKQIKWYFTSFPPEIALGIKSEREETIFKQ